MRAAGLVSALTLVSRLLGLAREQTFAALLGAGFHADAFQMAFRIPNLLRDLFAEGALSAAFVPTYARVLTREGPEAAHRLASRLLTVVSAVLSVLVVAAALLADPLVSALAPGFGWIPGKLELTVFLTRVMLPFLPMVSFAAIAMGMLNAEERYGMPAISPALFNVVTIVVGGLLFSMGLSPQQVVLGWSIGTLLGGVAQFLVQVPALRRSGWRFRPEWRPHDPELRVIGRLMAPATVGLAAVQVNLFVNSIFASHQPGAVSWLQYAFRLLYLPIGIFGVAVGTVATTGLARRASVGDLEGMRQTLRESLGLLAFMTVPATAGLAVVARPVIRLLYEHGRFGVVDTEATAAAVALYSIGLVAYTGVKVMAPAFYALGTPRVPLVASGLAVLTNLIVILSLQPFGGYGAVALGTSLGSIANVALLLGMFERRVGGLLQRDFLFAIARMVVAAALMAPVADWTAARLEIAVGTHGLRAQLLTGLVPVAAGIAVYGIAALALGIPEAQRVRMSASRWRR
jgi:putative peptidoglycan lipid II flippase